jgi:hypothetical protein
MKNIQQSIATTVGFIGLLGLLVCLTLGIWLSDAKWGATSFVFAVVTIIGFVWFAISKDL